MKYVTEKCVNLTPYCAAYSAFSGSKIERGRRKFSARALF